MNKALSC